MMLYVMWYCCGTRCQWDCYCIIHIVTGYIIVNHVILDLLRNDYNPHRDVHCSCYYALCQSILFFPKDLVM